MAEWSIKANLPVSKAWMGASVVVNEKLYVFGGGTGSTDTTGFVTTCHALNIASNTWTTLAALPLAMGNCLSIHDGGDNIYVVGKNASATFRFYRYSISLNTWTALATPSAHSASYRGPLYWRDAAGDFNLITATSSSGTQQPLVRSKFNITAGTWVTQAAPFRGGWYDQSAIQIGQVGVTGDDGHIYFTTGYQNDANYPEYTEVFRYNTQFDQLNSVRFRPGDAASGTVRLDGSGTATPAQTDEGGTIISNGTNVEVSRGFPDGKGNFLTGPGRKQDAAVDNEYRRWWRIQPAAGLWDLQATAEVPDAYAKLHASLRAGTGYDPLGKYLFYIGGVDTVGSTVYMLTLHTPPNAPVLSGMTGGEKLSRQQAQTGFHTFSDPDFKDAQASFTHRYKLVSEPTVWTEATVVSTDQQVTYPPLTFAAGDYMRQVKTKDQTGLESPYSASSYFTMGDEPAAPAITSPAPGATVASTTATVTWNATAQSHYHLQLLDPSDVVKWDSGTVASATTSRSGVPLAENNVTRKVRVRYQNGQGIWSAWSPSISFTVSWPPPATPTTTVVASDRAGIGARHIITTTVTNPTPTGEQPTVATMDLYARLSGSTDPVGTLISANNLPGTPIVWDTPAFGTWQTRVRVYSADGPYADSIWKTQTGGAIGGPGFMLHDPLTGDTSLRRFLLNDTGAAETEEQQSAFITYQGREFPTVEFGVSSSRVLEIATVHLKSLTELENLRTLARSRRTLSYRDNKGRSLRGTIAVGSIQDTFYGYTASVTVTVTDI